MVLLSAQETESSGGARKPASLDALDEEQPDTAPLDLPAAFDSWELEERLRHVKRLLAPPAAREDGDAAPRSNFRVDAGHAVERQFSAAAEKLPSLPEDQTMGGVWASFAAWSAIAGGLAALTCGGVLCGWSLAAEREELWTIGLPVLLTGQMTLVFGLLLQLRRVWRGRGRPIAGDDPLGSTRRRDSAGIRRTR
jgi:hypothetical protein